MDNYLTTCLVILVFVFLLWCIGKLEKLKSPGYSFENGFKYAQSVFSENNFRHSLEELNNYIEESRTFGSYNDFDAGVEQSIKQNISDEIDILNDREGGDWYFCEETLKFKDSLTSREIIL